MLVLNTADKVALSDSDVVVEVVLLRPGIAADFLDLILELLADTLFDFFELVSFGPLLLKKHVAHDFNWVTCFAHFGNLIFRAIGDAGVGHGVAVVSVRGALEENRTVFNSVGTSPLDCLLDHKDVLGLDFETWDSVASRIEVCVV